MFCCLVLQKCIGFNPASVNISVQCCLFVAGGKQQAFFRYGRSKLAGEENSVDKRGLFRYGKRSDAAGSILNEPEVLWFDEDNVADDSEEKSAPSSSDNSSSVQTQREQLLADAARLSTLASDESDDVKVKRGRAFLRYGRGFRYGKRQGLPSLAAGTSQLGADVDKRTFRYGRSTA